MSQLKAIRSKTFDENGNEISLQNPMQVDGDSVHVVDIDYSESVFTSWTGDTEAIFKSPFSASITNVTATNPKIIDIAFNRTVNALQIGLGENNGGDFSNVKISLLGSAGTVRALQDDSADSTKRTSLNVKFENELFNKIRLEFYTADQVDLSNITIQKASYNTSQIQGVDPNGEFRTFNASNLGNFKVALAEYQGDAFGRLRVSEPHTIFDNSLTNAYSDDLFWSELTNATGSGAYANTTSSYELSTATAGDYVVRQTKQRFKYQPGKSHEILITGLFSTETGQLKRVGLLDYDNVGLATISDTPQNGVCFSNNAGVLGFCIYNNGVKTEEITQANWNVDVCDGAGNSGFTLDVDSTNIIFIDMEWLGVGAVRCGFVSDKGEIVIAHQFRHASKGFTNVYMRTANLPVSYSITSSSGAGSMKQICCAVMSEGGYNPVGILRGVKNAVDVAIASTVQELMVGIRLKEDNFENSVIPSALSVVSRAKNDFEVSLLLNPTYSGTVTWVDLPNSSIQYAVNNSNVVSDEGIALSYEKVSGAANATATKLDSTLRIGKDLSGNKDELWIAVTAEDGAETLSASLTFKDLL